MNLRIPYTSTKKFSTIVEDYVNKKASLRPFYQYPVDTSSIPSIIQNRQQFHTDRVLLTNTLKEQYSTVSSIDKAVNNNISLLAKANTYTITTAHQPNIFTGPLYVVYKILHTIQLAHNLSQQYPSFHFVPVFYMGSEDADLEELNNITVQGKKYTWQTSQTGAVGRMLVDQSLIKTIDELHKQLSVFEHGNEWISLLQQSYKEGRSIQEATFELINLLFGKYGLIVLIPDNALLKKRFESIVKKELTESFAQKEVEKTAQSLTEKGYKVQTKGRDINLFYLLNNRRERIIKKDIDTFEINNTSIRFNKNSVLTEVTQFPDRFSANVVLRGLFQETILPNILFVGGGGELAYWLELKTVFQKAEVPFPMLVLRNSFLLINEAENAIINKLQLPLTALFEDNVQILEQMIKQKNQQIDLQENIDHFTLLFQALLEKTNALPSSLHQHIHALAKQNENRLHRLQKKVNKALRRNLEEESHLLTKLKEQLFPNNSLQERIEHFGFFYSIYGNNLLHILLENSPTLSQEFSILLLPKKRR